MSDENKEIAATAEPAENGPTPAPPAAEETPGSLMHAILGGLIAAVRHLVAVTPAAHNLAMATDEIAAAHNQLRIMTSPEPETPPAATDPTDIPAPAPSAAPPLVNGEPDPAEPPAVTSNTNGQPQF